MRTNLATLGSGYCLLIAFLYASGYWNSFGVRVLEYAGFHDLLRFAAHGIVFGLSVFVLGMFIGMLLSIYRRIYSEEPDGDDGINQGDGEKSAGPRLNVKKEAALILGVTIFGAILVAFAFIVDFPAKWDVAGLYVLIAVSVSPVEYSGLYKTFVPNSINPLPVAAIAAFVLSIPFWAYAHGDRAASASVHGTNQKIALLPDALKEGDEVPKKWLFLGILGDNRFLYSEETEELLVLSESDASGLRIRVSTTSSSESESEEKQ
ncbi:hypothetical protein IEI94_15065 [Halomonas sp. ML-15]|uniref:hypothetical protein n=1 Tax=Halomonas sp. ML-15 TaxID=2773305 RepID=UPI001746030C|nr:hypothetical protein [Halomonas sp. ML-15]MBD3897177.1 hypothetical protein [Halomonas sp. ML-15]